MTCEGCQRQVSPLKRATIMVERNGKRVSKVAWLCTTCRDDKRVTGDDK